METGFPTASDAQERTIATTRDDTPQLADAPLADPLCRWIAKFVDLLIATALSRLLPPIGFFAGVTYLLVADGVTPGHSVGKRVLGLVVWDAEGSPCSVRASIVRNVFLVVSYVAWYTLEQGGWILTAIGWTILVVVFGTEGLLLIGNPQGLRFGDELARTAVVGRHAAQARRPDSEEEPWA